MVKRAKSSRPASSRSARRTKQPRHREEHAPADGVSAQVMGAQRKLWQAGASALARGGKIGGPISPAALAESLQGGIKKLEEVFDQRVLNSLSHAGMPSPQEMRDLMERVASLSAEVKRLSGKRSKR